MFFVVALNPNIKSNNHHDNNDVFIYWLIPSESCQDGYMAQVSELI